MLLFKVQKLFSILFLFFFLFCYAAHARIFIYIIHCNDDCVLRCYLPAFPLVNHFVVFLVIIPNMIAYAKYITFLVSK